MQGKGTKIHLVWSGGMRITAMDIDNKEFKRSIRGYNPDEVDEFLDQIAEDYETLYKENSHLKEQATAYEEKIQHYKKIEDTIQNTLLLAQNAADQAKKSAQKEADIVIKNANDSAQRVLDKAHNDVLHVNEEYEKMKQEFNKFRTKYRNFMNSQIEMFESLEKDFDKSYNIGNNIKEIVGAQEAAVTTEAVEDTHENTIEKTEENIIENKFKITDFDKHSFREPDLDEIKTFFTNK